jgi:hypothetical protein
MFQSIIDHARVLRWLSVALHCIATQYKRTVMMDPSAAVPFDDTLSRTSS